ncbi:hypothetical protein IAI10_13870 [Clostridium sp. 19966]|uniref:hypothetical protein n=1 Tax=Clostridium sp. 19966 TaxID=2768166 RepID=UPI0028E08C56|nr:hypothetical protein [Clostridium sp. 19966]MDT8717752.1 hypothetical protein [Clostridium sp. 19966]
MKIYINKNTISFIILVLVIISIYGFCSILSQKGIPSLPPNVLIKYSNKAIPTTMGEHTWLTKNGSNSYLTEDSYSLGESTSIFTAKSCDFIEIHFSSKPQKVKLLQWIGKNNSCIYKILDGENDYKVSLPLKSGEYIFEVLAYWDANEHNTSNIFRVKIFR